MAKFKLPFSRLNTDWPLHPCIPIRLSNPLDNFEIYCPTIAVIDTGAVKSAVPNWVAKAVYHCDEHPGVKRRADAIGIGGRVFVYEHTFDMEITDFDDKILFVIEDIKIDVLAKSATPCPVLLGLEDFLLPYVEVIDFKKKHFVLNI